MRRLRWRREEWPVVVFGPLALPLGYFAIYADHRSRTDSAILEALRMGYSFWTLVSFWSMTICAVCALIGLAACLFGFPIPYLAPPVAKPRRERKPRYTSAVEADLCALRTLEEMRMLYEEDDR